MQALIYLRGKLYVNRFSCFQGAGYNIKRVLEETGRFFILKPGNEEAQSHEVFHPVWLI